MGHPQETVLASMGHNNLPVDESTGTTIDALIEKVESLEQTVQQQSERINELETTVEQQSTEIEQLHQKNSHLLDDVLDVESDIGEVDSRLSTIEGSSEGQHPNGNDGDSPATQTPLEQITAIPETMVSDQLTENQQRARFVANDIRDYADKRLGDWVLSSKDLRRVLSAREQSSIHYTTVKRVIEFLDELGQDDVSVKDKHGTIVCFSPEIVNRIKQQSESHGVVTGNKGKV